MPFHGVMLAVLAHGQWQPHIKEEQLNAKASSSRQRSDGTVPENLFWEMLRKTKRWAHCLSVDQCPLSIDLC